MLLNYGLHLVEAAVIKAKMGCSRLRCPSNLTDQELGKSGVLNAP